MSRNKHHILDDDEHNAVYVYKIKPKNRAKSQTCFYVLQINTGPWSVLWSVEGLQDYAVNLKQSYGWLEHDIHFVWHCYYSTDRMIHKLPQDMIQGFFEFTPH